MCRSITDVCTEVDFENLLKSVIATISNHLYIKITVYFVNSSFGMCAARMVLALNGLRSYGSFEGAEVLSIPVPHSFYEIL